MYICSKSRPLCQSILMLLTYYIVLLVDYFYLKLDTFVVIETQKVTRVINIITVTQTKKIKLHILQVLF